MDWEAFCKQSAKQLLACMEVADDDEHRLRLIESTQQHFYEFGQTNFAEALKAEQNKH